MRNLSCDDGRQSRGIRSMVERGAYVLVDTTDGIPEVVLIGTGSEVDLCVQAAARLKGLGVQARALSMPSWEIFQEQSLD